jgi:hypothetical protein
VTTHLPLLGNVIMATKQENPQEDNWWLNGLESLGVSPKVRNELNDIQETSSLTENLKQIFYQANCNNSYGHYPIHYNYFLVELLY